MTSVLQNWVMALPLREQGTLLTAVRGCDLAPKVWDANGEVVETQERQLVAWIRCTFMVPVDPREVHVPGSFFRSRPPKPFKPSGLGHYPLHWVSHVMHALEVIGYRHPDWRIADEAKRLYEQLVHSLHLQPESEVRMVERLSEDRILTGTVVS